MNCNINKKANRGVLPRRLHSAVKILTFIALIFLAAGCATAPAGGYVPGPVSLADLCARYDIRYNVDSVSQVVTLARGSMEARALVGSNVVIVDGKKTILSLPLKRKRGIIYVPADFESKVIDPLAKKMGYTVKKFREVIVDSGHGGKDPGAIGVTGLKEKNIVLDIARRLQRKLEQEGVKVIMTRDSDEFISLERRAEIARMSKADLFISIHANASRTRVANGIEVYYLRDLDDVVRHGLYDSRDYQATLDHFSRDKGSPVLDQILADMLYNYKQAESRNLARHITHNTSNVVNAKDLGSKSAGFYVLKNNLIPSILVEVGFLSNRKEEGLLETSSYRQQIAESLANDILSYDSD